MKGKLAVFILMVSGLVLTQCASDLSEQDTDILFQTKTIATLLEGDYDGNLTMKALNKHGDFGLGTGG